jgi:hypothetical protein
MRLKLAVVTFLAGLALAPPIASAAAANVGQDRAALEKVLLDDTAAGPLMHELKQEFPDVFNELLGKLSQLANDPDGGPKARALAYDYMHRLSQGHLLDVASAPDDKIDALLASQAAVTRSLQRENVELCAKFGAGALPQDTTLSPRTLGLLAAVSMAQLKAIRAGIDHPTARPELSPKDAEALRSAMTTEHLRDDLATTFFKSGLDGLSAADQCEVSLGFYAALATLPPDVEARWGATIFAAMKPSS